MTASLLSIEGLTVSFGGVRVVDGVDLDIPPGTTVGLVGESGSGKSVTALSILRLLEGAEVGGHVRFRGTDLSTLPERELRALRGNRIAMVFQDPMTSLNPVLTVGEQVAEGMRLHERKTRTQAHARAVELLALCGVPSPEERARAYPHELSGGMRQRVMIAMALACKPDLLIADEPTTALDVTIQAQILELLRTLQRDLGMSVLLITHDLGVVAETCEIVYVMYAGRVVEKAPVQAVFRRPRHPYTAGLLASIPGIDDIVDVRGRRRLRAIPGSIASPARGPVGCRFQDRCDRVADDCRTREPALVDAGPAQSARCLHMVPAPGEAP